MNFYQEIKSMSLEERERFVKERIDQLEQESSTPHFLGYQIGEGIRSGLQDKDDAVDIDMRCYQKGYLKKGSKVVYGFSIMNDGTVSNKGNYYYINDDQYIYDFCNFISSYDVSNEYEFFDLLLKFIRNYFGYIKDIDREEMFHILFDSDGNALNRNIEHDLSWFHKKGNAMCSEYTVMAQNLLSVFGFDVYSIVGMQKVGEYDKESHAFNIVSFLDGEDNTNALIDFSSFVNVYDESYHKIGEAPFIGYFDQFDDDFVKRFVQDEEHLVFEDYNYMVIGNSIFQIAFDRNRDYWISSELVMEPVYEKQKKGK